MCGIAGFFTPARHDAADALAAKGRAMGDAIAHRGPDDHDVWTSAPLGLALAHRRLAIIDLSPQGRQPMASNSGRYVTVYNGEIYNYPEMRAAIDAAGGGGAWRGHSDTEVLLAAFELWGVERTLREANGMFAIALVDLEKRLLILARDRAGEKPLYYGWQGDTFLFGSELKALLAHPAAERVLDEGAVAQFLRFAYVPAPRSIWRGISKLPAGSWIEIPLESGAPRDAKPSSYWQWPVPGVDARDIDVARAAAELDPLLRRAIGLRMRSDVPLGAFLSGGIDSSTIVALMQAQSSRRVRTFSIGFAEAAHDEAAFGRAVAERLGTDHTELRVTAADALAVVPAIGRIWDEPFADSSQIPTYLLAKLTREHVTVSLSGDAGDELFGGYVRYIEAPRLLRLHSRVPHFLRAGAARGLDALPGPRFDRALAALSPKLAVLFGGDRLHKLAAVLGVDGRMELYRRLVSQWPDTSAFYRRAPEPRSLIDELAVDPRASAVDWMMLLDQRTYLPDDILVKVDRATMAVALESRVPFLDPEVIAFAAGLPAATRIGGGIGKLVLRELLGKYLDRDSFLRPKQGFAIPLAEWLRGPLRDWAESLLSRESLTRGGLLDVEFVRRHWEAHASGARNLHYPLWNFLMLQAWVAEYRPRLP
jgi:asparagine synthase (glutamine-hydrolysing)